MPLILMFLKIQNDYFKDYQFFFLKFQELK